VRASIAQSSNTGGWGYAGQPTNGMAYNVSGNMGVQLETDQWQKAADSAPSTQDELERAIKSRM